MTAVDALEREEEALGRACRLLDSAELAADRERVVVVLYEAAPVGDGGTGGQIETRAAVYMSGRPQARMVVGIRSAAVEGAAPARERRPIAPELAEAVARRAEANGWRVRAVVQLAHDPEYEVPHGRLLAKRQRFLEPGREYVVACWRVDHDGYGPRVTTYGGTYDLTWPQASKELRRP